MKLSERLRFENLHELAAEVAKLEAENATLKRLLTSMTCGECDETMLDCTCPDTKSLLTAEGQGDGTE